MITSGSGSARKKRTFDFRMYQQGLEKWPAKLDGTPGSCLMKSTTIKRKISTNKIIPLLRTLLMLQLLLLNQNNHVPWLFFRMDFYSPKVWAVVLNHAGYPKILHNQPIFRTWLVVFLHCHKFFRSQWGGFSEKNFFEEKGSVTYSLQDSIQHGHVFSLAFDGVWEKC